MKTQAEYVTSIHGAVTLPLSDVVPGSRGEIYVKDSDVLISLQPGTAVLVHPGETVFVYTWKNGFPAKSTKVTYKELWEVAAPHAKERDRNFTKAI